MKRRKTSIVTILGLLVVTGYLIFDSFIKKIPDNIAIPILILAIILIIAGNIISRVRYHKSIRNKDLY